MLACCALMLIKPELQKLQIRDSLMQNSIIYGHCRMVAWRHEKSTIMKPKTIQQEILLIAGTNFSRKEYCLKDPDSKETTSHSTLDNLEKACWQVCFAKCCQNT